MKRVCLYVCMIFVAALALSAETLETRLETSSFGRSVQASIIDGTIHWIYPAAFGAAEGKGRVNWTYGVPLYTSCMQRITLPIGEAGVVVVGTNAGGNQEAVLFRDVWGGLEQLSSEAIFTAEPGEDITGFFLINGKTKDEYAFIITTTSTIHTIYTSPSQTLRDVLPVSNNKKANLMVQAKLEAGKTVSYLFGALYKDSMWKSCLWKFSDGQLFLLGEHEPIQGGAFPKSTLFNMQGTRFDVLMLTEANALLWSWSGTTAWGKSSFTLVPYPDSFYWRALGERALFLNHTETGFTGTFTSRSGDVSPSYCEAVLPGPVVYRGEIRPYGVGFRMWYAAKSENQVTVYSVEVTGSGSSKITNYGVLDDDASSIRFELKNGNWFVHSGYEKVWILDEINKNAQEFTGEVR